jgi:hypothetical protein
MTIPTLRDIDAGSSPARAPGGAPPRLRRFRRLTRHFFRRFFDNDLVSPGGDSHVGLSHVIGAFITPGLLVVALVLFKYSLVHSNWARVAELSFDDALLYVALSMIVLGLAATITWDAFFLEARDHHILGVLPVGHRLLAAAKLGALGVFLTIFVGAANAVPVALVPVLMLQRAEDATFLHHLAPLTAAHAASTVLAGVWAVLAVVALRGVLALMLPARLFRRIGPLVQGVLILGWLAWFVALPQFLDAGRRVFEQGGWSRDWSPPMWFLGLYQSIIGQPQPAFHVLARLALVATGAAMVIVVGLAFATPARHQSDLQAGSVVTSKRRSTATAAAAAVARRMLTTPHARATFRFTLAGLGRSATHRIYLAGAVGAALAWSASGFIWTFGRLGLKGLFEPAAALLLMQPIVVLFVAAAIRFGVGIPLVLPANWIFRVTEGERVGPYHVGTRGATLLACGLPVAALLPVHASLWSWDVVVYHAVVGVCYAVCIVEVLFNTCEKLAFTAPYVSGSIRLKTRWWMYLFGAWALTGVPAFFEARVFRFGSGAVMLPAGLLLLAAGLAWLRRRREAASLGLAFVESPDDACQTLGLFD